MLSVLSCTSFISAEKFKLQMCSLEVVISWDEREQARRKKLCIFCILNNDKDL
ncbi:hypothetical protein RchiOBHm_Chr3g0455941 [Rosa chinensis]|uniref:Uncharacterized protein n=1 Tax=Rosa chinensis TaxID=74649 RepID=A0A2P6R771_ROSCH|nr:hypothetical protein RchiOBHm_Chr3g0455941 [Rosa chinensis]